MTTIRLIALATLLWTLPQTPPAHVATMRIATGGIELAATLTTPAGEGPFPAVLLLNGSGAGTRQNLAKFSSQLNAEGFATLVFDKRGSGESTGSWTTASFSDNVNDAKAAVAKLGESPRIDPKRIGIWGVSQAGWFIPAIVDQTPSLAFAIVLTGGGSTPREVEMFMHEAALTRANVSDADRTKARQLLEAYFTWLGDGVNRAGVVELINRAKTESWYAPIAIDGVMPSDTNRPNWEWVATYDPMPLIEKMRLPTLVVLGAADLMGSTPQSAERWRAGFAKAGGGRSTVVVIEGMGHAATIGSTHAQGGAVMPEYTATVAAFLAAFK